MFFFSFIRRGYFWSAGLILIFVSLQSFAQFKRGQVEARRTGSSPLRSPASTLEFDERGSKPLRAHDLNHEGQVQGRPNPRFFSTTKNENGRWYFQHPDGHRFFSLGLNSVREKVDRLENESDTKFNERLTQKSIELDQKVKSLHFNTVGAWSDMGHANWGDQMRGALSVRTPKTINLDFLNFASEHRKTVLEAAAHHPNMIQTCRQLKMPVQCSGQDNKCRSCIQNVKYFSLGLMYVPRSQDLKSESPSDLNAFATNPDIRYFKKYVSERLNSLADKNPQLKNDNSIIGYFTDNEILFPLDLLDLFIRSGNPYLEKVAENFLAAYHLQNNHNQGQRLSIYYNLKNNRPRTTEGTAPRTMAARKAFLKKVTQDYFQSVHEALKENHFPQLVLGTRFHRHGSGFRNINMVNRLNINEIFEAAGPFVDVISVNYYHQWNPDQNLMSMWHEKSGRPFLISEFYAKEDNPDLFKANNSSGAGWILSNQQQRGQFYQHFVLNLIRHPANIGIHWFNFQDKFGSYTDQDGNSQSNGVYNTGIRNPAGTDYFELQNLMTTMNPYIKDLRWRINDYCGDEYSPQGLFIKSSGHCFNKD